MRLMTKFLGVVMARVYYSQIILTKDWVMVHVSKSVGNIELGGFNQNRICL